MAIHQTASILESLRKFANRKKPNKPIFRLPHGYPCFHKTKQILRCDKIWTHPVKTQVHVYKKSSMSDIYLHFETTKQGAPKLTLCYSGGY